MAELKKRKRSSGPSGDAAPIVAKKQAAEKNQPVFGWKEAKQVKASNPPFILEPAGCQIPDDVTFHVYTRERIGNEVPKDATPLDKHEHLLYSNDHPHFEFKAREDPLTRWTRIFVGVQNAASGKKEMVQTKKLIVRAVPKDKQSTGAPAGDSEPRKAIEMATELGRLFGSKKAKKAILEKERNEISLPPTNADGSQKKLNRAAEATMDVIGEAGATMATREEMQATVDASKPVPRANLEAEDIQDVYDPVELIGRDILNGIPFKDWQEAVESGEGVEVTSRYVASRVDEVARGPNKASRLRLLRYVYFLITFYTGATRKGHSRRAARKKEYCEASGASGAVAMHMQNKYTDRGDINSFYDALILTHIFVFVSILDNFELEIQNLREDLGIDQEKFSQHFNEIGGRVIQAKERGTGKAIRVARLAMPLQFPKQRRIQQKRR